LDSVRESGRFFAQMRYHRRMGNIKIYAHRCGPQKGPENTIAAFKAAISAGAAGVELSAGVANYPRDVRWLAAMGLPAVWTDDV
jgi:hypothetical protein